MNVTFTANTAKELKTKMMDFFSEFNVPTIDPGGQLSMPIANDVPVGSTQSATDVAPEKVERRGRKPKSDKATEASAVGIANEAANTLAPMASEAVAATENLSSTSNKAVVTKETALDALKKVHEGKGLDAARDVLKSFNANRVSDLSPDNYAAFAARCETELLV